MSEKEARRTEPSIGADFLELERAKEQREHQQDDRGAVRKEAEHAIGQNHLPYDHEDEDEDEDEFEEDREHQFLAATGDRQLGIVAARECSDFARRLAATRLAIDVRGLGHALSRRIVVTGHFEPWAEAADVGRCGSPPSRKVTSRRTFPPVQCRAKLLPLSSG